MKTTAEATDVPHIIDDRSSYGIFERPTYIFVPILHCESTYLETYKASPINTTDCLNNESLEDALL